MGNTALVIREIREIRGKKPSRKRVILTESTAKKKALCVFASLRLCVKSGLHESRQMGFAHEEAVALAGGAAAFAVAD